MKMKWLIVLSFLLVSACEEADTSSKNKLSVLTELKGNEGLSHSESLTKWQHLKDLNGNSYIYQTTYTSWNGWGHTTELKIEDGAITGRTFQEFTVNDRDGSKAVIASYHEDKNNLGTHEKGALLLTIDDLYEICAKN